MLLLIFVDKDARAVFCAFGIYLASLLYSFLSLFCHLRLSPCVCLGPSELVVIFARLLQVFCLWVGNLAEPPVVRAFCMPECAIRACFRFRAGLALKICMYLEVISEIFG